MKIVITSGYFNPIHPGHIDCFRLASRLGDQLWVIVNNDHQAQLKRGVPSFQNENDRASIVGAIKYVNEVFIATDSDTSVCCTLEELFDLATERYKGQDLSVIFAKGGDRMASEIPESQLCREIGIQIVDGLGSKTHNSSDYLRASDKS